MKGGSLLRNVSLYARDCLLRLPTTTTKTPTSSFIPLAASTRARLSFYSSGRSVSSGIPEKDDPQNSEDDVTGKELKKRVQKFFDGDDEAIPSIFEAILERKLAKLQGKHDEKDEELMEKICGKREELHSDSEDEEFESDSDEFSGTDEEEIDDPGVARDIVNKKMRYKTQFSRKIWETLSGIHEKDAPVDAVEDIISKELKQQVEKFFEGDKEAAVPSIFHAILERKLAKLQEKHDETDYPLTARSLSDRPKRRSMTELVKQIAQIAIEAMLG